MATTEKSSQGTNRALKVLIGSLVISPAWGVVSDGLWSEHFLDWLPPVTLAVALAMVYMGGPFREGGYADTRLGRAFAVVALVGFVVFSSLQVQDDLLLNLASVWCLWAACTLLGWRSFSAQVGPGPAALAAAAALTGTSLLLAGLELFQRDSAWAFGLAWVVFAASMFLLTAAILAGGVRQITRCMLVFAAGIALTGLHEWLTGLHATAIGFWLITLGLCAQALGWRLSETAEELSRDVPMPAFDPAGPILSLANIALLGPGRLLGGISLIGTDEGFVLCALLLFFISFVFLVSALLSARASGLLAVLGVACSLAALVLLGVTAFRTGEQSLGISLVLFASGLLVFMAASLGLGTSGSKLILTARDFGTWLLERPSDPQT